MSLETSPALFGSLRQLENHGDGGLVRETAPRSDRSMPNSRERALDRVCGSQVLPVLGGEIVEGEERVAVLGEAFDGFVVLNAIGFDERIQCNLGGLAGLRHPNVLQCALGLGLQALWQLVQDIRRFVYPAALRSRLRPHLIDRLPEAERPVGDGELRPLTRVLCRHGDGVKARRFRPGPMASDHRSPPRRPGPLRREVRERHPG